LHLSSGSELNQPPFNKALKLLENLEGLDWVELTRTDECCGFGGTFAVTEEALSIQMGKDRLADHLSHKTEIITGGDMSCIMHLQGIATRSKQEVKFLHLAEILNQALS
jgi:L-lactate dehydrogenase complex protein LldE